MEGKQMYKISVIIPVYNAEKTLPVTLKSVCSQSLTDTEIICIDDGSTDHSYQIIRKWQQQYQTIRCIRQHNQGAGTARNKGMAAAAGEYIAFMDADDTYSDSHVLEKLYQAAMAHNAVICGGSVVYNDQKRMSDNHYIFRERGWQNFANSSNDFMFGRYIFKREFLMMHHIDFPDLRIYEDPVFLVRAMTAAQKFYAIPDVVYGYHGPHQVQNMTSEKVKDYLKGLRMELILSSKYQLAALHKRIFKRLETEACFYAEPLLYTDQEILLLLLKAEMAIDHSLISLEEDYLLPPMKTLWRAAGRYMLLYRSWPVRLGSGIFRKMHLGRQHHECQKKYL